MGDNMSKRLKLSSATEAEMEERSFPNPYPDWDPGVLASDAEEDVDLNEPSEEDGQVRCFARVVFLMVLFADVLVEAKLTLGGSSLTVNFTWCVLVSWWLPQFI
uniref:Uncharacterized protein n=1 Tax=Mola mola TaxID=94237 RepID=A0A3Q3WF94_MOLML